MSVEIPPRRPTSPTAPFLLGICLGVLVGAFIGLAIPHPWRATVTFSRASALDGRRQEGTAVVPPAGSIQNGIEVYYSIPFSSPPQLEFPQGLGRCFVEDQTANKFRIKNTWSFEEKVDWKATGVPAAH